MTNRTGSDVGIMPSFLGTLCLAATMIFSAAGALAADNNYEIAAMTTIRGTVHFEKRNTVVPFSDNETSEVVNSALPGCEDGLCPRSNPYWAVLVDDGQHLYELHQPFAIGEVRSPKFIEVNGVKIRPGFEVAIEGSVDEISPNYGIIADVKSISVLSSKVLPAQGRLETQYQTSLSYGWNCVGFKDPFNGLNAYVWYGQKKPTDSFGFHLRMTAKQIDDHAPLRQGVTVIYDLEMKHFAKGIVYQGAASDMAAILAIQGASAQVGTYPSSLKISNTQGSLNVRMFCSPVVMMPNFTSP
jgi:hypothetical protein